MRKLIVLMMATAIILIGCSKENPEESKQKDNHIEPKAGKQKTDEQKSEPNQLYPLTGIETDETVDQRPVAIMINNHPKARPQSGLSQADIVFEILAEGNITRFLAVFQSEYPDVAGPVRSAREYYFDLADRYHALYVYHGAANFVDDMIQTRGIEHINGSVHDNDGMVFKRESFRKAPHNSYFQFKSVHDVAEDKGYDMSVDIDSLPFLDDNDIEQIDGDAADNVHIDYASTLKVDYEYDHESESYLRSSDGEPTLELNTDEQIKADNVFIVEAHHEVIDDEGRRAIDLESGGKALLIQKGNVQHVDWKSDGGRMIPVKDGEKVGFVPGKTWINVLPSNPGLEQSVTTSSQ